MFAQILKNFDIIFLKFLLKKITDYRNYFFYQSWFTCLWKVLTIFKKFLSTLKISSEVSIEFPQNSYSKFS